MGSSSKTPQPYQPNFDMGVYYNPVFPPLKPPQHTPYPMREPYPTETAFFLGNPTVAGMAAEDGSIIFNPTWAEKATPQQKQGLYYLEASRHHMKTDDAWKDIKFTPEQEKYFKSMGDQYYSKLGDSTKQTLVSRLLVGDEIPDAPYTEEQQKIADKIWSNMTKPKKK
jgi:hypothetical protein